MSLIKSAKPPHQPPRKPPDNNKNSFTNFTSKFGFHTSGGTFKVGHRPVATVQISIIRCIHVLSVCLARCNKQLLSKLITALDRQLILRLFDTDEVSQANNSNGREKTFGELADVKYCSKILLKSVSDADISRIWEPSSVSGCSPINCHHLTNGQLTNRGINRGRFQQI